MPSAAIGDAMNETLTPHEAARVLAQASSFEASLQQRTEGLTAMVWAAVAPGIYLSYALAGASSASFPDWGWSVLWIPWTFAGTLITIALWRSAALSMQEVCDPVTPLGYLWRFALLTALAVVVFSFWDPDHYGGPLLVIGALYLAMAAFNPYRMSRRGRLVGGASGVGFLAIGTVAMSFPETGLGFTVAVILSGLLPLAAGFWQTMTS